MFVSFSVFDPVVCELINNQRKPGNGNMLLLLDVTVLVVVSDGDGMCDRVVRQLGMNVEGDGAMAC